jgi:glycerol uptake facilitator-like aquaporin
MTNQFWFKPRTFGYGATPSTWEGWAAVAVYVVVLVGCIVGITVRSESFALDAASIATIVVATVVMIAVSVQKTDGAWGWNAGTKQNAGKKD